LTIPTRRGDSISLSGGTLLYSFRAEYTDQGGRIVLPGELAPSVGAFWDRNESLMGSLQLVGIRHPAAIANIYPGLLSAGDFHFGLYACVGYYDGFATGLSISWLPLGPGFSAGAQTSQEWP